MSKNYAATSNASRCSSSFEQGTRRFAIMLVDAYSPMEWDEWMEQMDLGFERSGMSKLLLRDLQRLAEELHDAGEIVIDNADPEWPVLRKVNRSQPAKSQQSEMLF
ncbi:MAG: hypothetical protein WBD31_26570 [Rubripirellula sp.]